MHHAYYFEMPTDGKKCISQKCSNMHAEHTYGIQNMYNVKRKWQNAEAVGEQWNDCE